MKMLIFPKNDFDYYLFPVPQKYLNLSKDSNVPECLIWWDVLGHYVFHADYFDYSECLNYNDLFEWTDEDMKNEWYLIHLYQDRCKFQESL